MSDAREAGWTIRSATADDLAAICALGEDLAALHHEAWPAVFAPAPGGDRDAPHWRESITGDGRAAFVAERAGEPLGFITLGVGEDGHSLLQPVRWVKVISVCVRAAARGQGIGSALMAAAEAWAREQRASEARLVVWAFNRRALRLYEELGYEVRSLTLGKALGDDAGGGGA